MTVINIRGTSGSGKSTIVKKLLDKHYHRPLLDAADNIDGYFIPSNNIDKLSTVVIGPYNKPTGGCDNISPLSDVFESVYTESGYHVIFEGLLVSRSKGRVIDLWNLLDKKDLHIIHLTTSLEECLKGIEARRLAKGNVKPVNPFRTEETYTRVAKITRDLEFLGIPTYYLSREQALPKIEELLGIV
jgi:hypothetical protein